MSELDITAGDPIIYGEYAITGITFALTGFAQADSVTVTPIGEAEEKVVDGKTVKETYANPGLELSGDFVVTTGDEKALVLGKLINVTFPGESTPKKFVVQSAPAKYDSETGSVIVSLSARHRYSMVDNYDAGPVDPATGDPYAATFRISGFVINADGGAALAGVVVSDGTRSATTNALGFYQIIDVPAGTYTLTPTKTGFEFNPATLSSGAVAANVTGKNFIATET